MPEAALQNGAAAKIAQLEAELNALRGGQLNVLAQCPHGYADGVHGRVVAGRWSCDVPPLAVKLDLGCSNMLRRTMTGMTRDKGWVGVDVNPGDGVDVVCDLGKQIWPWPDSSVDEANCAHMLEHVPAKDIDFTLADGKIVKSITFPRLHFFNELWRVLKPGAKALFITPHWASCRAYGDVSHEWPPVSEMFWQYLNKQWRAENAPHLPLTCDFDMPTAFGYSFAQWMIGRNQEWINEKLQQCKEAAQDMTCTMTARKP